MVSNDAEVGSTKLTDSPKGAIGVVERGIHVNVALSRAGAFRLLRLLRQEAGDLLYLKALVPEYVKHEAKSLGFVYNEIHSALFPGSGTVHVERPAERLK